MYRRLLISAVLLVMMPGCEKIDESGSVSKDLCPDDPAKVVPGVCGCGVPDVLDVLTGTISCPDSVYDLCPNDPDKTKPGICGCGVADTADLHGNIFCLVSSDEGQTDLCPDDPDKTLPGICGCGVPDTIDKATGIPECLSGKIDMCPNDPIKTLPGVCGCGVPDTPDSHTGIPLCIVNELDFCPNDPDKDNPGVCGCGVRDIDSDGDGVFDCEDKCPDDPEKKEPGTCGCGVLDSSENISDADRDGVANCIDVCPLNSWKSVDDGCSCNEIAYSLDKTAQGCAEIIASAEDFIAFRDKWNAGEYGAETSDLAFILVDSINLGDVLTQGMAEEWVPVGTEDVPFNAIFLGDNKTIRAVYKLGSVQQTLRLGSPERDNMALFGVVKNARMKDLNVSLSFIGASLTAGVAASADTSSFYNVTFTGNIIGTEYVGSLIGKAAAATLANIKISGSITGSGSFVGGLAGWMEASTVSSVRTSEPFSVKGGRYTGGLSGYVMSGSSFANISTLGSVSGDDFSGGVFGVIGSTSKVYNAFTIADVTCSGIPCALFAAHVGNTSTLKNIYSTGMLIDNAPTGNDSAPETPLPTPAPSIDPPVSDGDPADTEDEDKKEDAAAPAVSVSVKNAALIASIGDPDNVFEMLYYWQESGMIPLPDITGMPSVSAPVGFVYKNLYPYTAQSEYLLSSLNANQSCNGGLCTIDGTKCQRWESKVISINMPGDKTMSVHLPILSDN